MVKNIQCWSIEVWVASATSALASTMGNVLIFLLEIAKLDTRYTAACLMLTPSSRLSTSINSETESKLGKNFCAYCGLDKTKAERQTGLAPYGFSCRCPACINDATPAANNLSSGWIACLRARVANPNEEWADDILPSVLPLEKEMVTDGLESELVFFGLLNVIPVSVLRLGRRAEEAQYEKCLEELYQLKGNVRPGSMIVLW